MEKKGELRREGQETEFRKGHIGRKAGRNKGKTLRRGEGKDRVRGSASAGKKRLPLSSPIPSGGRVEEREGEKEGGRKEKERRR